MASRPIICIEEEPPSEQLSSHFEQVIREHSTGKMRHYNKVAGPYFTHCLLGNGTTGQNDSRRDVFNGAPQMRFTRGQNRFWSTANLRGGICVMKVRQTFCDNI